MNWEESSEKLKELSHQFDLLPKMKDRTDEENKLHASLTKQCVSTGELRYLALKHTKGSPE